MDPPPPWLTGEEILRERINNIKGLSKSVECGGNGHDNPSKTISEYEVTHNWVLTIGLRRVFSGSYRIGKLIFFGITLISCTLRKTSSITSRTHC